MLTRSSSAYQFHDSAKMTKVQTREEFIEAHWEEALVIDAKMREAAVACVKNFLGEDQEVHSNISRENWTKCFSPLDYFVLLAYSYSPSALDQRILRSRSFIEGLFQFMILQASIGNECVTVVAQTNYEEFSISKARLGNKANGNDRRQAGIEQIRMIFHLFQSLPVSYEEMGKRSKEFPRRSLNELWLALWRKKKTDAQKSEQADQEAMNIQEEVTRICDFWSLDRKSMMDKEGWLLDEIELS